MNARQKASVAVSAMTQAIDEKIVAGTWAPGYKLPTERELAEQFGIARATARKCLEQLESSGRIVRHVGRGTFVAAPESRPSAGFADRTLGASPAEVLEVRLMIEPSAIEHVVARANSADFRSLLECIEQGEAATTVAAFEHWDGMLHKRIIAATHNQLLIDIYETLDAIRNQAEWGKLKERSMTADRRRLYEQDHRALVSALRERDAERAEAELRSHLLRVRMNLFGL